MNTSYLKKKHNFRENVEREQHEGWYKYTVGNYSSFDEAKKQLDAIRNNKVSGAFIAAYKNGKRVPLSEVQAVSNE